MADTDKPAWVDKPSWTVKPWILPIPDQLTMQVRPLIFLSHFSVPIVTRLRADINVDVQDLIDTPLEEAQAKLEKRLIENKIALAVQELDLHKGRIALEQHLRCVAEWNRYRAEYIAEQMRVRDEKLAEKRAAKRARTQVYL